MTILFMSLISTVFYIGNQWISVGVTDETQTVRAGSVSYLHDHWSGAQIGGSGQFSGVNTGSWIPASGEITVLNDTTLVFHTDHGALQVPPDVGRALHLTTPPDQDGLAGWEQVGIYRSPSPIHRLRL